MHELIIGGDGRVGSALRKHLLDATFTSRRGATADWASIPFDMLNPTELPPADFQNRKRHQRKIQRWIEERDRPQHEGVDFKTRENYRNQLLGQLRLDARSTGAGRLARAGACRPVRRSRPQPDPPKNPSRTAATFATVCGATRPTSM
jgi:nucleoside-diphosphate-sugar epimerase